MKTVHFAFTLLALSMVAAFPLIGESFAQADPDITPPTVESAKVTGPNEIIIEFDEKVTVPRQSFSVFTITPATSSTLADGTVRDADDLTRNVINVSNVSDRMTYRVTIDGAGLGTDAAGSFILNADPVTSQIRDQASPNNNLAASTDLNVTDGQSPQIKSVRIIDNDNDANPNTAPAGTLSPQVEIVYTESVVATTANYDYSGLNVNDIAGVIVDTDGTPNAIANVGGVLTAPTHILTLSGSPLAPETTGSINFIVSYTDDDMTQPATGLIDIVDSPNQNVLKTTDEHPLTNHPVEAGQIPTVVSAMFIDNPNGTTEDNINRIAIKFSEDISSDDVSNDNFTSLVLNDGTSRNPDASLGVAQGTGDDGGSTIILTYLGTEITTGATGTINIAPIIDNTGDTPVVSSLKDAAGNAVKAETAYVVKDGQKPKVLSAKITGPNELSIEFSERVIGVKSGNFGEFYVGNDVTLDAAKRSLTLLNTSGEIIKLRISGDEIDTSAEGRINITVDTNNDTDGDSAIAGITDDAKPPNTMLSESQPYTVEPGQTPKIKSAKIVSPSQVHIVFSERIQLGDASSSDVSSAVKFYEDNSNRAATGYTAMIYDSAVDLIAPANEGDTIILIFSDSRTFTPKQTGRVSITNDIISATNDGPAGSEPLLKFEGVERYLVEAGQIPTITSAKITGPKQVTVTFSEPVQAGSDNFTKFTLTGGTGITLGETRTFDTSDINAQNHASLATTDNEIVLTIDSPDDLPTDAIGTINIAPTVDNTRTSDSLRDKDGIFVDAVTGYMVTDGQSPNLTSATLTAPNQITIKFSEKINAVWSDFTNLKVDGNVRNITGFSGSGSDTITLTVGGNKIASTLADNIVRIDIKSSETDEDDKQSSLVDLVGNPLMLTVAQTGTDVDLGAVLKSDVSSRVDPNDFLDWPIAQGQVPMVTKASITDSNTVTLKFSIPVNAVLSDFTFTVSGENTPRAITGISGSGTETIVLTISGTAIIPEATGTICLLYTSPSPRDS